MMFTRRGRNPDRSEQQPGGTRRILDDRLARGEIDTEEYRRLLEILDDEVGHTEAGTGSRSGR